MKMDNPLATLERDAVRVWDVPRSGLVPPQGTWSPDGRRVASTEGNNPYLSAGAIRIVESATGSTLTYAGHAGGPVGAAAWAPDGKRVATASADHTVQIWEAATGKVLFTLGGHGQPVEAVWLVAGGRRLVSLGKDPRGFGQRQLRVWDASTGTETMRLVSGNNFQTNPIAVSDEGLVAAIGFDRNVPTPGEQSALKVWDSATGAEVFRLKDNFLHSVTLSRDGKRMVVGDFSVALRVIGLPDGKEIAVLKRNDFGMTSYYPRADLSPDGQRLAIVLTDLSDRNVAVWEEKTGKIVFFKQALGKNPRVSWCPDSQRLLAYGGVDAKNLTILDTATGEIITTLRLEAAVPDAEIRPAWSPDGKQIAGVLSFPRKLPAPRATLLVWDAANGKLVREVPAIHTGQVADVEWSPDGKCLVTGGYDQTARVWDVATGKEMVTFLGHVGDNPASRTQPGFSYEPNGGQFGFLTSASAIAWSPSGRQVATAMSFTTRHPNGLFSRGCGVRIWDPATGATQAVLPGLTESVSELAWSADGRRLATLGRPSEGKLAGPQSLTIWDPADGKKVCSIPTRWAGSAGAPPLNSVAFRPDGGQIAAESNGRVRIWDAVNGKEVLALPEGTGGPLAWSANGRWLAVTMPGEHGAGMVVVHDAQSGAALFKPNLQRNGVRSLLWGEDGKRLFIGGGNNLVTIWAPETGTELLHLKGPGDHLSWGPKGSLVGSAATGVTIWEAPGAAASDEVTTK
jgi:WD40 repeat protein